MSTRLIRLPVSTRTTDVQWWGRDAAPPHLSTLAKSISDQHVPHGCTDATEQFGTIVEHFGTITVSGRT